MTARSYPTWIITQQPKEVPFRKGPFHDNKLVEAFLREAYRLYPEIICIVVDGPIDNTWWPQHGYEWLDINGDGRKRHPRKDRPSSPAPKPNAEPEPIVCDVLTMQHSSGFPDHFTRVRVGRRELTLFMSKIKGRCEYHAAELNWLLNGAEKPHILDFPDDEPEGLSAYLKSIETAAPSPQPREVGEV